MIRITLTFHIGTDKHDIRIGDTTYNMPASVKIYDIASIDMNSLPKLKKCKYLEININSKRYGF